MDVQSFEARVRSSIDLSRTAVDAFLALPESATLSQTVRAVDDILLPLNETQGWTSLFAKVHPDAAVRDSARTLEQELAGWSTDLSLHRGLYEQLRKQEAVDGVSPTESTADEARVIEVSLRAFRHAGVDRDQESRDRIKALKDEIVRIGQEFDKNIIEDTQEFVIADGHAGLGGLPQDFLDAHPEAEDGSVRISTDPQDRMPFLTFAERDDLRRDYYRLVMQRAAPQNLDVLRQLLTKRHELANLLGFSNWADYVTEDKMARSGTAAREFLERVVDLTKSRAQRDYDGLLAEKRKRQPDAKIVHEWERGFLGEKIRKREYDFDSQSVRPYFQYDRVRDGVLSTSAELYGVEFRKVDDADVWHDSVECYDVLDGGEVVARFWLDMHPRDGKFKHAAMFDISSGVVDGVLPEACLVCNFPQPQGDDPGLMLRSEVRTYFHEFGHLLHHLFSRQRFVRLAGISCEWDFVEVPSQLFEEWSWDLDVLQRFALHHETNEPIPKDLVDKMRAAEDYGKGMQTLTQMYYALLSLSFYESDPASIDLEQHMIALKRELLPFPHEEGTCFIASFGHLHGYSAMYYTYMWSLVIAKDFFGRFEGQIMNRTLARQYRDAVLARGSAKPAADLVRDFLGRDYDFGAFERWLNAS